MPTTIQIVTMLALAIDAFLALMLFATVESPAQDAAGKGMAQGFFVMMLIALGIAVALLGLGMWTGWSWPIWIALIIAALPMVPVLLPVLL